MDLKRYVIGHLEGLPL